MVRGCSASCRWPLGRWQEQKDEKDVVDTMANMTTRQPETPKRQSRKNGPVVKQFSNVTQNENYVKLSLLQQKHTRPSGGVLEHPRQRG